MRVSNVNQRKNYSCYLKCFCNKMIHIRKLQKKSQLDFCFSDLPFIWKCELLASFVTLKKKTNFCFDKETKEIAKQINKDICDYLANIKLEILNKYYAK